VVLRFYHGLVVLESVDTGFKLVAGKFILGTKATKLVTPEK